jgi:hypothetical protein
MTPWEADTFFRMRLNNNNSSINSSMVMFAPQSLSSNTTVGQTYIYAGELRRGIHTYVADRNDNNLTIVEQTFKNPAAIGIFDSVGLLTGNAPYAKEEMFTVESDARFVHFGINHIIDGNNLVHVAVTGGRTARIRTVNLITKTMVSDRRITLDTNVIESTLAFFKDKLYAFVQSIGICEFDTTGRNLGRVMSLNSGGRFFCLRGEYLLSPLNGSELFITDGVNNVITQAGLDNNSNMANLANAVSLKPPLTVLNHEGTGSSSTKYIGFITPYMATINNLTGQVVKNNLNTMKVTYELTQA